MVVGSDGSISPTDRKISVQFLIWPPKVFKTSCHLNLKEEIQITNLFQDKCHTCHPIHPWQFDGTLPSPWPENHFDRSSVLIRSQIVCSQSLFYFEGLELWVSCLQVSQNRSNVEGAMLCHMLVYLYFCSRFDQIGYSMKYAAIWEI